jgi:hypothetical protein
MKDLGQIIDILNDLPIEGNEILSVRSTDKGWRIQVSKEFFYRAVEIWTVITRERYCKQYPYELVCQFDNVEVFCLSDRRP